MAHRHIADSSTAEREDGVADGPLRVDTRRYPVVRDPRALPQWRVDPVDVRRPDLWVATHHRLADDLATFIRARQRAPTEGGPLAGPHSFNRGGPVTAWDEQTRTTIEQLAEEIDVNGAVAVWDAATAAEWCGPDVWGHGDLTGSNLLMSEDRLCGVIDFGCVCAAVGDPACDVLLGAA